MKELSLQELREIELDILRYFHAFCVENNIRYYLSHGTLLGAIRYKKFIPWDDDIDLLIPREDYNRMLTLFKDDEKYKLFSIEREPGYHFPFAKLCDMTTRKIETGYRNIELGVDIDLFPLDAWDDDIEKAKKEAKYIYKNIFYLALSKLKRADSKNPIKRLAKAPVMLCARIRGSRYFVNKILKASSGREQKNPKYLGCKVWCVYSEKGIIPAEAFDVAVYIEFEGETFLAPRGYDTYLTCLYGDYMPEPPKEKQKTHHNFVAYRL